MSAQSFESRHPANHTDTPDIMTPQQLHNQLRDIAYINRNFRQFAVGSFSLSVEEGERIDLLDHKKMLDSDDEFHHLAEHEWPHPRLTEGYSFDARRVEVDHKTHELKFEYAYLAEAHNIHLPPHIAAYAYGQSADAVQAAGPSRMSQSVRVAVENYEGTPDVRVCETVEYYDVDADLVASLCSCPYPQDAPGQTVIPQHISYEVTGESDDDTESVASTLDPNLPLYFRNDAVDYREHLAEAPSLADIDDAATDYERGERELLTATNVLRSMRRAFRTQLGLRI